MRSAAGKPRIAVVLGDPAGIGPETTARLLAAPQAAGMAEILVIADRRELEEGMRIAGVRPNYRITASPTDLDFSAGVPLLFDCGAADGGGFERAASTARGGRYCLDTLRLALHATRSGATDAIVFGPLNKHSLHLAGMSTSDELHWLAGELGHTGPVCEFNVMDGLWTSRVTSHVALKDVPRLVTAEGVMQAITLIHAAVARSGEAPRIAVCGLNPHNGDHGSFGREEIDVIEPAVARAREAGLPVDGPFPADTIFLKVQGNRRDYNAVVTMYHDQGQIAMKLMGFWRGVTVQGGLPLPVLTPAHGTAFDIVGQGVARVDATLAAFELACRMAARTGAA